MANQQELTPYQRAQAWMDMNEGRERERDRDVGNQTNDSNDPVRADALRWWNRRNDPKPSKDRSTPNDEAGPKSKFWGNNQDPRDPPAGSAIAAYGGKTRRRYKKKSRGGYKKKSRRGNKKSRRGRK
jgi:hypothetical protein